MTFASQSDHPPIYRQLVQELGDVLTESREVAEQTRAKARDALDFDEVRRAHQDRETRAFSAFGR